MIQLFYSLVAWALSGTIARLLVGAGLTLVVFAGIDTAVEALLGQVSTSLGGLPGAAVDLMLLSGVGTGVSILGSAVLTRIGLTMAGNLAGLRKT